MKEYERGRRCWGRRRAVDHTVDLLVVGCVVVEIEEGRREEGVIGGWLCGDVVVVERVGGVPDVGCASEMAEGEVRPSSAMARARTAQRRGGQLWGGVRAVASGNGTQCCSAWWVQRRAPSCQRESERDEEKIRLVYRCAEDTRVRTGRRPLRKRDRRRGVAHEVDDCGRGPEGAVRGLSAKRVDKSSFQKSGVMAWCSRAEDICKTSDAWHTS